MDDFEINEELFHKEGVILTVIGCSGQIEDVIEGVENIKKYIDKRYGKGYND